MRILEGLTPLFHNEPINLLLDTRLANELGWAWLGVELFVVAEVLSCYVGTGIRLSTTSLYSLDEFLQNECHTSKSLLWPTDLQHAR